MAEKSGNQDHTHTISKHPATIKPYLVAAQGRDKETSSRRMSFNRFPTLRAYIATYKTRQDESQAWVPT